MEVTKNEVLQCKRAVVVLTEMGKALSKVAGRKDQPLEVKQDILVLLHVIQRLEKIAK